MNTSQTCDQELLDKRTYHFKKRQSERGISCQDVVAALRLGHRHEYGRHVYYFSRGLYIVADRSGNLVTAYWLQR